MRVGTLYQVHSLLLCLGLGLAVPGVFGIQAFCQKTTGNFSGRESARQDPTRVTSGRIEAWARSAGFATGHLVYERPPATSQEIRLRWNTHASAPPAAVQAAPQKSEGESFTVIHNKRKAEPVVRQRAPRISSGKIVVFALGAQGQLYHWLLIPDPRILRAEHADAQGRMSGRVLHYENPEFLVHLPEDSRVTELRFYRPRWTGKEYALMHMATVSSLKPATPSPER